MEAIPGLKNETWGTRRTPVIPTHTPVIPTHTPVIPTCKPVIPTEA